VTALPALSPLALLLVVGCGVLGLLVLVMTARWFLRAVLLTVLLVSIVLAISTWWFGVPAWR
jgi:hypothetical protein